MTENGLDIQTISTKQTDFQTDRILLLGHVKEKKEEAQPSHFLKFLTANNTNGTLGFVRHKTLPLTKPKEPFYIFTLLTK